MNGTVVVILACVVGALSLLALTIWMLNRAWGENFPGSGGTLPSELLDQYQVTTSHRPQVEPTRHEDDLSSWWANDDDEQTQGPAGSPTSEMVEITHTAVRQAILTSLERGGSPYATFFVQDDDKVYLALYRIHDPAQRATAQRVVEGLNDGRLNAFSLMETLRHLRPGQ
ncbi:hypothetical protein [Candidatus Chloroploca sp. Khr17]|uniref:hypothetical protein n=1 Tax=Candidatus Chloroploca sp. Khr17 TaxID=2496869 RepID=UPI00101E124E|nr:hypothetical protein [Candidatus Chloroploca sp. Khr17]